MGVESNAKQNLENFSKSIHELSYRIWIRKPLSCPFRRPWNMCSSCPKRSGLFLPSMNTPMLPVRQKASLPLLQLLIDQYKDHFQTDADPVRLVHVLYGRSCPGLQSAACTAGRTAQMKILPFNFEETCHYFKNFTDEDKALCCTGSCGGTPQYLLQMSDKLSIEENIKNTFLNADFALIYEEPDKSAQTGGPGTGALQCHHHGHCHRRFPYVGDFQAKLAKTQTFAPPM